MDEIRMEVAVKLFELGRLSSGPMAELAGVSRIRFRHVLDKYDVTVIT